MTNKKYEQLRLTINSLNKGLEAKVYDDAEHYRIADYLIQAAYSLGDITSAEYRFLIKLANV